MRLSPVNCLTPNPALVKNLLSVLDGSESRSLTTEHPQVALVGASAAGAAAAAAAVTTVDCPVLIIVQAHKPAYDRWRCAEGRLQSDD
jgi:hypothetical protein